VLPAAAWLGENTISNEVQGVVREIAPALHKDDTDDRLSGQVTHVLNPTLLGVCLALLEPNPSLRSAIP
jgi:hypothetical protein